MSLFKLKYVYYGHVIQRNEKWRVDDMRAGVQPLLLSHRQHL